MSDETPPPYGSTPPPQQPPSGQYQPPPPYGAYGSYGTPPPYGGMMTQDHPQAVTVLVIGILGLVLCQLASPFAWVMGTRVVREIDESQGRVGGRGTANAGRILGIIGTVLIALALLFFVGVVVLALVSASNS